MGNPLTGGQIFGGSRFRGAVPPSSTTLPVLKDSNEGLIENIVGGGDGLSNPPVNPAIGGDLISSMIGGNPGGVNVPPMETRPVPVPKLPSPPYTGPDKTTNPGAGPMIPLPQPPVLTTMQPPTTPTTPTPAPITSPSTTEPVTQPSVMKSPRRKAGPKRRELGTPGRTGTRPISMF